VKATVRGRIVRQLGPERELRGSYEGQEAFDEGDRATQLSLGRRQVAGSHIGKAIVLTTFSVSSRVMLGMESIVSKVQRGPTLNNGALPPVSPVLTVISPVRLRKLPFSDKFCASLGPRPKDSTYITYIHETPFVATYFSVESSTHCLQIVPHQNNIEFQSTDQKNSYMQRGSLGAALSLRTKIKVPVRHRF
jgi:hypothetical protein